IAAICSCNRLAPTGFVVCQVLKRNNPTLRLTAQDQFFCGLAAVKTSLSLSLDAGECSRQIGLPPLFSGLIQGCPIPEHYCRGRWQLFPGLFVRDRIVVKTVGVGKTPSRKAYRGPHNPRPGQFTVQPVSIVKTGNGAG